MEAEISESATGTGERNVSGGEQNLEYVSEMLAADRMKPDKRVRRHPVIIGGATRVNRSGKYEEPW